MWSRIKDAVLSAYNDEPIAGLNHIPGTKALTVEAALLPPLLFYVALLFLPPAPPPALDTKSVTAMRNVLAIITSILFIRLPLAYHVPQSIGLTYQLGLVGFYGGTRVLDVFFVTPLLFNHVPKRVRYHHQPRAVDPRERDREEEQPWSDGGVAPGGKISRRTEGADATKKECEVVNEHRNGKATSPRQTIKHTTSASDALENMNSEAYSELLSKMLNGPDPLPVLETAKTDDDYPHDFYDRASWALELMLSMRGVGFSWTTADIRHTKATWLPGMADRLHSISVHAVPVLLVSWAVIRSFYQAYFAHADTSRSPFDELLSLRQQLILTAALGAFLMAAFSLAHSLFAIVMSPLAPSPFAFFPPLYTTRIWKIKSTRGFWSYGWHRLFARLFLVWGVWPGEWVERKLTGKSVNDRADVGKIMGGFASSAIVHSLSVRGVLGGRWSDAKGEAIFFMLNGVAVVLEGAFCRVVKAQRRRRGGAESMWYDGWVGRVWWISVLLWTGRNFARGWTKSNLVKEMAFA